MNRFNYETGEYDIESHPFYNGYDYDNQAWVQNGKYVRCGHPESMACGCYGRKHEGETVDPSVRSKSNLEGAKK